MRTNLLLNTFTAGQICEWMFGRTDTTGYAKGAKSLKNCIVRPFGGAMRRPGTLYIGETKTTGVTRLMPFSFSIEETYIVEVGAGYFRFYKDGAIIETAPDTPYEVANTFTETDVTNLKYTQSNDVLFLAVGAIAPKKLSRISDTNWTYEDLGFENGPFLLENSTSTTITPSGTTGNITLTASSAIFEANHVGSYWSINIKKVDADDNLIQGTVQITGYTSPTVVSAVVTNELFAATATTIWAEGAWSNVRGYPYAVAFADSRLWFANTDTEPQKVWGSEVFVYNNFDKEESVEIEIPSNKFNAINSLVNGNDLAAFTLGGNFIITSGSTREAITGENISAYQQSNVGANAVQAQRIGDYVYYAQRAGEKLMEFKYNWEVEGYVTSEISMLNEDVLESGITEMALQETEDNVLFCTLNNGKIATLTRVIAQDVSALSPQETDGEFVSVASISNDAQFWDDTYVIVQREINGSTKQYIELFSKPRKTDLETGVFCDCAKVYDEPGGITTLTGLDYLEGKTVQILRDGSVEPEQVVSSGEITLEKEGFNVVVGLQYISEIETMPFALQTAALGTTQGQLKRPISAVLKFIDTMGVSIEGATFDEDIFLRRWNIVMGTPNPLFSGDVKVDIPKDSELESTIKIKQELPLPMNLLSIAVQVEISEE